MTRPDGDGSATDGYRLLVSVGDPTQVDQLMRTAVDIARDREGEIHVLSVITRSRDSPFALMADEAIVREFGDDRRAVLDQAVQVADEADMSVSGELRVGHDLSAAILEAVSDIGADAVLLGWEERSRPHFVLGSNVDRVIAGAPGDVLIERIGALANGVESILVPSRGGVHAVLAAETARGIAASNDARIEVAAVTDEGGVVADPSTLVEGPDAPLADIGRVTVSHHEGPVADTVVALASDHDIVVLAAPPRGLLQRFVVEPVAETVGRRVDRTVIMTRRNRGLPSRLARLFGGGPG